MICIVVLQHPVPQEPSRFLAAAFAVLATAMDEGSLVGQLTEGVGPDSYLLTH